MATKRNQHTGLMIILLCLIMNISVFAQAWPKLPATISGKITKGLNPGDSIVVNINEDNPKWSYKKQVVPIRADGSFRVLLDSIHQPAAIRMSIRGRNYMIFEREIEPGDSLFLEIDAFVSGPTSKYSGNMPKYSGNNTGKYRCEDSMNAYREEWNKKNMSLHSQFAEARYSDEFYTAYYEFLIAERRKMLEYLANFKDTLSPAMYEYLKAKYTADYLPWSDAMRFSYMQAKKADTRANIIRNFIQRPFPEPELNPAIAGFSSRYLGHVFANIQVETWFEHNGKNYPFKVIYEKLKSRYSGFLQERLLAFFLYFPGNMLNVENYDPADFEACLADAQTIIKDPYLKKILNQKSRLKPGTAVYPFAFPDTNGNVVKLADLKGNVVLLDLWGLGCSGCAQFYQLFEKEVQPHLKNERHFKFLSLNDDNSVERWKTGIKSGKYTNEQHINLYMEGKGIKHPFSKFYHIVSAPFIILIDKKGNLITYVELGLSSAELLKTIKTALAKNSP
jgi:thioredoxin-related protein